MAAISFILSLKLEAKDDTACEPDGTNGADSFVQGKSLTRDTSGESPSANLASGLQASFI
jgi:hypothetical protein